MAMAAIFLEKRMGNLLEAGREGIQEQASVSPLAPRQPRRPHQAGRIFASPYNQEGRSLPAEPNVIPRAHITSTPTTTPAQQTLQPERLRQAPAARAASACSTVATRSPFST